MFRVESRSDVTFILVQTLLPEDSAIYQDDNTPIHIAAVVKSWFDEHADNGSHLPWAPQSPSLIIIEPILENNVGARFLPPASLRELERLLHEERYQIPLSTIQDLYLSSQ